MIKIVFLFPAPAGRKDLFRMKNIKKLIPVLAGVLLLCMIAVFAEGDAYISANDPLITLSYVEQMLKPQLKEQIKNEVVEEIKKEGIPSSSSSSSGSVAATYEVISVSQGQQILAEGNDLSCEIILRSGSASAVAPGGQGLSDLTAGNEISDGASLGRNHYIVIPRGDGRGVVVTTDIAYFMIRGEYRIVG